MAIVSSLKNQPLPQDLCVFGEVGLSGEIRPVVNGQARLNEAYKHGFRCAVVAKGNAPKQSIGDMKIIAINSIADALRFEL